ncbi:MAG: electron transfer flavoprotein-ubiquinone oxidoreductase [Gammaproteobacteria bacterium]|nr:electron transfer flavoprotein-ubiquinone oxidoreductase [Gammaproteobacteria bacterium]|tara:strand:+ start:136 stop:1782 length:1647 start_codon:yes stop_codon:yes gene_type:complete
MSEVTERESMEFDVIIIGGGPAGLAAACRLMQLNSSLSVAVVEKGSEIGAHILSGNVFEPSALNELFPDWQEMGAPVNVAVSHDRVHYLINDKKALPIPGLFLPKPMNNHGNFIISLGKLCKWLGDQAENMGVNVLPGFAAAEVLYENNRVVGVATSDMGINKKGEKKSSFQAGYELTGKYVIFAEGVRGNLSEQVIEKFNLRKNSDPQHYGIGIKEIWDIDGQLHEEGRVIHTLGWPLDMHTEGGGFLYHAENKKVLAGFIVGLNYKNPYLSPFEEFQRWKKHSKIRKFLEGGKRIAYGARAVNKGGLQSLPKLTFPGGMLIGCAAGFLNGVKIKGSHTAIKTGMLAAESIHKELSENRALSADLSSYEENVKSSWVHKELYTSRNFNPGMQKLGTFWGGIFTFIDQNIFFGRLPFTLHNKEPDHKSLKKISDAKVINYPKPDGKITFDRLSSVFLSSTNHEEDQPSHLVLKNDSIPITYNLPEYGEPAQLYCPAGVYEIIEDNKNKKLQINAINCVHCKTCDIKDPQQNIEWKVPEGGGGPNYSNM